MRSRTLLVAMFAATLGLCTAVPAAASAPTIEKQPPGTDTRIAFDVCAFPVREDVQFEQMMVKVFATRDGDVQLQLSGSFTGTLTHLLPGGADGASVQINFSGPGLLDLDSGDLTAQGPWLLESPDDPNTAAFDGFLLLTRGLVEVSVDPDTSVLTIDSSRGTVTDLCAALA